VGSFLFGLGLFTIIHFELWLYTGKVGFVLDNKPKYFLDLLVCILGNFLGVFALCSILLLTRNANDLTEASQRIVDIKLNDSWYSIFIQAFMCGIMIYLAVKGHKEANNILAKTLFAFLPIVVFILCGFEHCVANVAYFTFAHTFSWYALLLFILMIIGNGLGSIFFDFMLKAIKHVKDKSLDNNK
jgi:formate/nitrite transporter FocA (FNT family)